MLHVMGRTVGLEEVGAERVSRDIGGEGNEGTVPSIFPIIDHFFDSEIHIVSLSCLAGSMVGFM